MNILVALGLTPQNQTPDESSLLDQARRASRQAPTSTPSSRSASRQSLSVVQPSTRSPLANSASENREKYGACPPLSFKEENLQPALPTHHLKPTEGASEIFVTVPNIPKLHITHANEEPVPQQNPDSTVTFNRENYETIRDFEKDETLPKFEEENRSLFYLTPPDNASTTISKKTSQKKSESYSDYGTFIRFSENDESIGYEMRQEMKYGLLGYTNKTYRLITKHEKNPSTATANLVIQSLVEEIKFLEECRSKNPSSLPEFAKAHDWLTAKMERTEKKLTYWQCQSTYHDIRSGIIRTETVLSSLLPPNKIRVLAENPTTLEAEQYLIENLTQEIKTLSDRLQEVQSTIDRWNSAPMNLSSETIKLVDNYSTLQSHLHFLKTYIKAKKLSLEALSSFSNALKIQHDYEEQPLRQNALATHWNNCCSNAIKITQAWKAVSLQQKMLPAALERKLFASSDVIFRAQKIGITLEKMAAAYKLMAEKKAQHSMATASEKDLLIKDITDLSNNIALFSNQCSVLER